MSVQSALLKSMRHPVISSEWFGRIVLLPAILGAILLTRLDSYLLFHSLADLFTVAVAFAVFILAWHSYSVVKNNYLLVLGIGCLSIALLDTLHVLSYAGMGVFTSHGTTLASQLWISARLLQAITVFIAPFFLHRTAPRSLVMLVYTVVTATLLAAIFTWRIFPVTFIDGAGVTQFKVVSEYAIVAILLVALWLLWKRRADFSPLVSRLLVGSVAAMVVSEAMFTPYLSLTETATTIGHLFKVVEFYLLYLAVLDIGLTRPYSLLFREVIHEDEQQIAVQRERAEDRTAELDAIFSSMTTGAVLYGMDGEVIRANAAAEAFFAYTAVPHDLPLEQRARLHSFIDEDGAPVLDVEHTPVYRALRGETVHNVVLGAPHSVTGDIMWLACSAAPVNDAGGEILGAVLSFRDITDRKLGEEEIRRLNQELEHRILSRTNQLEAANQELEAFAYSVSHDARAPLRRLNAYLELIQAGEGTAAEGHGQQFLALIKQCAVELRQLLDNLLVFSQVARAPFSEKELDLDELLHQVTVQLKPEIGDRDVSWNISPLPCVMGDRAMLRLVLSNLVSNALEFTRTREHACIEIGTLGDPTHETVIYVRDNGVGFDMAQADKLFGVFQRLHGVEDFDGTGIGLANVRRIISRHGGRTWAHGKVGEGATFYFSLPHAA